MYLDTNRLENPVDWNRRTPDELHEAVRALGITHDTTVILYGRDTEGDANEKWPGRRAGQIAASRAALILRYAGVDDVRLLDGGYDAWVKAGNLLETVLREPVPVASFGVQIPQRPDLAFYCGTGWRASETWFYAYLMGWDRIAVYDGGWFEWSRDPASNPIEVGEPERELAA
jgi:3-mercaptopyruvate sulfurtransferase SseA